MADGLLDTSIPIPNLGSIEKVSGSVQGKAALTNITYATLLNNIKSGKILGLTRGFNERYAKTRQDTVVEEVMAAEALLRQTYGGIISPTIDAEAERKQKEEETRRTIQKLASANIVDPKLRAFKVELHSLNSFPQKEDGRPFVVAVSKSSPKALMIPDLLKQVCENIMGRISLTKTSLQAPKEEVEDVPNWRFIFEGQPVLDVDTKEEILSSNESEILPSSADTFSAQDMTVKRMIAQIGEELSEVDGLLSGIGSTSPFQKGLIERRGSLLKVLSDLTGVNIAGKNYQIEPSRTEFQELIEEASGNRKAPTEEEHQRLAEELQAYYNDPEVIKRMGELQLQNHLFVQNTSKGFAKIAEAERKANAESASLSQAIDVIDSYDEEPLENKGQESGQQMQETEREEILDGAQTQADILFRADLKHAGEEQAQALADQDMDEFIREGAISQAQLLYTESLRSYAEEQARNLYFKAAGEEQAQLLAQQKQNKDLQEAGEEQARNLYFQGAGEEQAQLLVQQEPSENLQEAGEEQARNLYFQGAGEEQARNLYFQGVGEEQAQLLAQQKQNKGFQGAGVEQAQLLVQQEPSENLQEAGEEQARSLYFQGAGEEQARNLYFKGVGEEQAQLLVEQRKVLQAAADEQAEWLYQQMLQGKQNDSKTSSQNLYIPFVVPDRYMIVEADPRPLRISSFQRTNLSRYGQSLLKEDSLDPKDMLQSLKEQLDELGLGSSDNENVQETNIVHAM